MHLNQPLQGESDVLFDKISKKILRYVTAVLFFLGNLKICILFTLTADGVPTYCKILYYYRQKIGA